MRCFEFFACELLSIEVATYVFLQLELPDGNIFLLLYIFKCSHSFDHETFMDFVSWNPMIFLWILEYFLFLFEPLFVSKLFPSSKMNYNQSFITWKKCTLKRNEPHGCVRVVLNFLNVYVHFLQIFICIRTHGKIKKELLALLGSSGIRCGRQAWTPSTKLALPRGGIPEACLHCCLYKQTAVDCCPFLQKRWPMSTVHHFFISSTMPYPRHVSPFSLLSSASTEQKQLQ